MKRHKVQKTFQEINQKIRDGKVVVVTAEEIINIVKEVFEDLEKKHLVLVKQYCLV